MEGYIGFKHLIEVIVVTAYSKTQCALIRHINLTCFVNRQVCLAVIL
jgi:hypothetical protein